MSSGIASVDETATGEREEDTPVSTSTLMERMLERENLIQALRQVMSNKGCAGIDGMTVQQLPLYLKKQWPQIKGELLAGSYHPQPVKRVEIPKPGGVRKLGVPTVVDRFIQQALMQVLQTEWDESFSPYSYGFRPGRSAHQAIDKAGQYIREGYSFVVDIDLEKFFDRVNLDLLMHRVKERVSDIRVVRLINRFLKSGVYEDGSIQPTREGVAQGSPLSPLLANLFLNELDEELDRRGHRYVRYADDSNIYVRSYLAGKRVMASVTRFLARRLRLKVNEKKSAADRAWNRKFLGFTFTSRRPNRCGVSQESLKVFKGEIRRLTRRTRGRTIEKVVGELRQYLLGWKAYYGHSEVLSPLRDLDKWIRRRLRCYQWKQWGNRGYRELRRRGVSRELAWHTSKSAHGPWRLSRSPALSYALPARYFSTLGLPSLVSG